MGISDLILATDQYAAAYYVSCLAASYLLYIAVVFSLNSWPAALPLMPE